MKTETITLSKTETIIKCCITAAIISFAVIIIGKTDMHQFALNVLDWDSI
jgi:hypothetical protein